MSETTTIKPKPTTGVSTTNPPSTKQTKTTQNSKSTNAKNSRSNNKRKGQKPHSQHQEVSLHFKFSDEGDHTEHKVKVQELLLMAIKLELDKSKITKENIRCHFSDEGGDCDFRVSNQVKDKKLTSIKETFEIQVKDAHIGVTDVELKHQAGKKGGKEGESAGGKEKENPGRGRIKKGKTRKNREGAPQEQSSSSTVTVLAVVICFLLLGLLVSMPYFSILQKHACTFTRMYSRLFLIVVLHDPKTRLFLCTNIFARKNLRMSLRSLRRSVAHVCNQSECRWFSPYLAFDIYGQGQRLRLANS